MAGGPKLELRQGQSLVMTTQLQQSIKLLQYSALELSDFLVAEMDQNPLLTREAGEDSPEQDFDSSDQEHENSEGEREDSQQEGEPKETQDLVDYTQEHSSWDDESDAMLDAPSDAFWDDAGGDSSSPSAQMSARGMQPDNESGRELESNLTQSISLREHLQEQMQQIISDPAQRLIGLHLIDLVDDRGYVPEDLSSVTEVLSCTLLEVEAVLQLLQRCDPPGVCARNLAECLKIQMREADRLDPSMDKFLSHLELLAAGQLKQLARLCDVEEEDIPYMLEEIRALNPKPGSNYNNELVQAVIPDVLLRKTKQGWHVELNADALPRVLVNRQYYAKISTSARTKEDKKYLSEQLAHANWLTKALDQRAQTILKVSTEIVKQQDAFFKYGIRYFKPLVLRDIAQAVEMHESTVSRVTTQKYLSTGNAIYELKYFFSSSLGSTGGDGEQHSSESVKHMIKGLIDAEDPKNILSDDTLAEMLQEKGIDIARRTVAKYREAMDIASSVARRREKNRMLATKS